MVMTADQYQSEESAIKRRQAIAQMLMQQGQQPLETNQVAGGYVVPVSPLSAVAKIAQQLSGAYIGRKAEDRATKLAQGKRQAGVEATQSYLSEPDRKKAAISLISNEMAPESLRGAASSELTALNKVGTGREGIPSGFDPGSEPGTMNSKLIVTDDGRKIPYSDFLLEQAGAKKQQPGYLEDEKFKISLEDQDLKRAAAARADAQLRLSMQSAERDAERLRMAEEERSKPKPASEFQQFTMQQKQEKKLDDINDAVSNIDDTISDFNRLKQIQKVTTTGPISGSAPIAALRKLGPNAITGGENLQRLEKGYNELAVKAIGSFKAGGVTFGQLSNKEGEWIRSTQQTIDTGGDINQEMLDKGLKLLNDRKARLNRAASPSATEKPASKVKFLGFE